MRWKSMTRGWQCLSKEETEEFLKAYDKMLEIMGIDDEIDKVIIRARDPQGEPYKLVIRWNNKKLCWEANVI